MFEKFGSLTLRNATVEDAVLLSAWWNDGKIMAHAGFPNGTGETPQCIVKKILNKYEKGIIPEVFYSKWKEENNHYKRNSNEFMLEKDIFEKSLGELYNEYGIFGDYHKDVNIMLDTMENRYFFPEVVDTLHILQNKYDLIIGSTTDDEPLFQNLKFNNVDIFNSEHIFTSERLKCYKPDKDFYVGILQQCNLKSDEVVFVGDSLVDDVWGPKQLGICTVLIDRNNLYKKNSIQPNYDINKLSDLMVLLENI